MEGPKRLLYSL